MPLYEKQKIKNTIYKILEWDFDRVVMAHGSIIESNAEQLFIKGFENF